MVRRGLNPASATLPGGLFLAQILFGTFSALCADGAESSIDLGLAAHHFAEARQLCDRDGGKLWGHLLFGPILLVDPASRQVVASAPDREAQLTGSGEVFIGKLPANIMIANTAIDWAGVKWTMMLLPLPRDALRRRILLAHELWHRVQDEIGFPGSVAANRHLDTLDARIWLQLEWRALAGALTRSGKERNDAIGDALVFRAYRRSLFEKAAEEEERAMEMHEGLAEYTGIALSGAADPAIFVADCNLKEGAAKPTFIRSFAYASGPAYGILLDQAGADWRKNLKRTDDLGALLQATLRLRLPEDLKQAARMRSQSYGGPALVASETARASDREEVLAAYRQKFIDGPVFVIPLEQMKMQFDPGELISLDPRGTVYPNVKIVDVWGILTVSNGALLESDFSRITVSAPTKSGATSAKGDGWTLELSSGWEVKAGTRPGDKTVGKQPQ
ncbi:MAG: hypothetical protein QOF24_2652 [Verrucomicrobiota bacterium]|jgi:hypothetical protein